MDIYVDILCICEDICVDICMHLRVCVDICLCICVNVVYECLDIVWIYV